MTNDTHADLIELSDHVFQRFLTRMAGLTEVELAWQPTSDPDLSLRWRLAHLADLLSEERNGPWLGLPSAPTAFALAPPDPALNAVRAAYEIWSGRLHACTDASLGEPIGEVAGRYGEGTRRSFVLHVLDELVHHTAEAALLRDLYAHRPGSSGPAVGG
jgi:hypothetical protein